MASMSTTKSSSKFPKIKKAPTAVDMDAVRVQQKDMRHQAAKKAKEQADDLEVADSDSD
jgi:hypothetical protein